VKISLVTAVHNNQDTIGDAVESVRAQTYGDVEHVVVPESGHGVYDALNQGVRRAQGDVVGFLHSDAVLATEGALERIAAQFADPSVEAVYGDLAFVSDKDASRVVRLWRPGKFSRRKLGWGWMPPHPTFYVRSDVYRRRGGFDPRYRIAGDYDFMLRFLRDGGVATRYIPEVLVKQRLRRAKGRSVSALWKKASEEYQALRENRVGAVGALLWKSLRTPQLATRS
jgi:glycosyltransferase